MAGTAVVIDVREVAELHRAMRAASKASLAPLMDDIAGVGEEAAMERIRDGGPAPDGTEWPPRHPDYGSDQALLNRDGGLRESIQGEAGEDRAMWGSSLVYARIHQLGGTIVPRNALALTFELGGERVDVKSVTIPPRPYLGYGPEERRGVEDVIEAWLEGLFRDV